MIENQTRYTSHKIKGKRWTCHLGELLMKVDGILHEAHILVNTLSRYRNDHGSSHVSMTFRDGDTTTLCEVR